MQVQAWSVLFTLGHPLSQIVVFLLAVVGSPPHSPPAVDVKPFQSSNMTLVQSLVCCLLTHASVEGLRITSKVVSSLEPERREPTGRSLDVLYPDQTAYDAVYSGLQKPITVDCTQPGVICKFPLVLDELESSKPVKNIKQVPIFKGVEVKEDQGSKIEGRENLSDREDELEAKSQTEENTKLPVFKGSSDVENIDFKNSEDSWILEKNYHNKKYQIPVRLIPSKSPHNHGSVPVYHSQHDFHDHFSEGDPYHFASNHQSGGWTPWMRSYPAVYNYNHHNDPCQPPPVYHHPPPCDSAVRPTRKPVINVDDKVDKEEE